MLVSIADFVNRVPQGSVSMVKLRNYLFTLITGTYGMLNRNNKFIDNPLPTVGIDYINGMLIRVDMDYLLQYKNDIERFGKIEKLFQSPSFVNYIYSNPILKNAFIKSKSLVATEFVLPSTNPNAFETFPFESNKIDDWMTLRPLRMLSCPSYEFSCDSLTSKLRFNDFPPLEAVFSLNIPMLLLQYTKLRLLEGEQQGESTNRYPFIYKTCILPLMYDSYRSWLLEIFTTMALTVSLDSDAIIDNDTVSIGNFGVFAMPGFRRTMEEVRGLLVKCRDGKVKPDLVMRSLGLRYGFTLLDEISYLRDNHYIASEVQFYWLTFLKEYDIMKLVLMIYSLSPKNARFQELCTILRIRLRRLKNLKFWNSVSNQPLKMLLKSKFDDINAYVA